MSFKDFFVVIKHIPNHIEILCKSLLRKSNKGKNKQNWGGKVFLKREKLIKIQIE